VDPRRRFSGRSVTYERHRPGYPAGVLTFVEAACGPSKPSVVADAGSGTGLLSGLFLENGYRAFGVEPNREMREAAERRLGSCPCFRSVAAAEATTLPAASVNLVVPGRVLTCSQTGRARRRRAERAGKDRHALSRSHERLLSEHASDGGGRIGAYESIEDLYRSVEAFFDDGGGYETARFRSTRRLDFEGLKGLMFSYSKHARRGWTGLRSPAAGSRNGLSCQRFGRPGRRGIRRAGLLRTPGMDGRPGAVIAHERYREVKAVAVLSTATVPGRY